MRVVVPVGRGSNIRVETARVVDYDGNRSNRPYLVAALSHHPWPLPPNASLADSDLWGRSRTMWVAASELEPNQYREAVAEGGEVIAAGLVPRGNFDSFFLAILTAFQVLRPTPYTLNPKL